MYFSRVFVLIISTQCLRQCVFDVSAGRNLALNKTATQSSTYKTQSAHLAVDGNLNVTYEGESCSRTDYSDLLHWWQVDLGRAVKVTSVTLTFGNGIVFSPRINLALKKYVHMSSVRDPGERPPQNGVDGKASTCIHSKHADLHPWFEVDLQGIFIVKSVTITNRVEFFNRTGKFTIEVYRNATGTRYICVHYPGTLGSGEKKTLECDQPVTGRYVRMSKRQRFSNDVINICEFEVSAVDARRTDDFDVSIYSKNPGIFSDAISRPCHYKGGPTNSTTDTLWCDRSVSGRFVRISQTRIPLVLCQVYVKDWETDFQGKISARVQSSVIKVFAAESPLVCALQCRSDINCSGFNIKKMSQGGVYRCELVDGGTEGNVVTSDNNWNTFSVGVNSQQP